MIISYLKIKADNYYSSKLTVQFPVKVVIRTIHNDTGLGVIISDQEQHIQDYITGLHKSDAIQEVEVTYKEPTIYWTRVTQKKGNPSIHSTILTSGSMSQLPVILENGYQYHQILSPTGEALRKSIKLLDDKFDQVELLKSTNFPEEGSQLLTSKQYQAISLAYEMGYYDMPRQVTMREIGKEIGISRSATQDRIHRGEELIIGTYLIQSFFNTTQITDKLR